MIGSKANDVETKILSDRKLAGEGPTCDCLCDTFFQFVLGMRIKTVSDSQLKNVEKLLDYLPTIDNNMSSMLGPQLACDRGYGKKSVLGLLASKYYKVITITSKIGSEHPIVGSSIVESYIEKSKGTTYLILSFQPMTCSPIMGCYSLPQNPSAIQFNNLPCVTIQVCCLDLKLWWRNIAKNPRYMHLGIMTFMTKKLSKSYYDFLCMGFLMWIISSTPGFAFQRSGRCRI